MNKNNRLLIKISLRKIWSLKSRDITLMTRKCKKHNKLTKIR